MLSRLEKSMHKKESEKPDSTPMSMQTPIVYVKEPIIWEYKRVVRDLTKYGPTEDELNKLGQDGWELAGMFTYESQVHLYFKRTAD